MQCCGRCLLRGIVRCGGGGAVASPGLGLCHPGHWSRRVLTVYTVPATLPGDFSDKLDWKQVINEYGILKVIFISFSCTLFGSSRYKLDIKKMKIKSGDFCFCDVMHENG